MKYKHGQIKEFVGATLGFIGQKAIEWPARLVGGAVKGAVTGGRHIVKGAKDGMTSDLNAPSKSRAEKKLEKLKVKSAKTDLAHKKKMNALKVEKYKKGSLPKTPKEEV